MAQLPTTHPLLPPDELPLDPATLEKLFRAMGTDMVVVGGQALVFWILRYDLVPGDALVTVDVDALGMYGGADALGVMGKVQAIANALGAKVLKPPAAARTSLVAQLRVPAPGGKARNIDVLHLLYTVGGLKKSGEFTRRVEARSVVVELPAGVRIRVMHPLDVLESRAHNAVGLLDEKGTHVVTQVIWAMEVAGVALRRTAEDGAERLGTMLQHVYTLAHSQVGRRLLNEFGIELLDAVPVAELRASSPVHDSQLDRLERAIQLRRSA